MQPKTYLSLAAAVIALGLTAVKPASPVETGKSQSAAQGWRAEHQGLARYGSQGLGVNLPGYSTVVAAAESQRAAAGTSAARRELDRHCRSRTRSWEEENEQRHAH